MIRAMPTRNSKTAESVTPIEPQATSTPIDEAATDPRLDQFTAPEFSGKLTTLPICQILNEKSPTSVGLFIKEKNLALIDWRGGEPNYEHTFSSGTVEKGILFKSPRMHILAKSDRYVQLRETGEIIGSYETPEGRAKYEQMNTDPKKPATLRSFYVIFLLDENNQGLHTVPLVLSLHGVAAARFGEAYNQFKVQMEIAYAKAMQTGYRSLNDKFHCLAVFNPTFKPSLEPPNGDKKSWVAIPETVAVPDENSPIGKFLALDKQAELWALAGEAASFSKHLLKAADVVDDTMANAVAPQTVDTSVTVIDEEIPY
jgi:Family of unknown function (DUF5895)